MQQEQLYALVSPTSYKLAAYKRQLETPLALAFPQINILLLYINSYVSLQILLLLSFSSVIRVYKSLPPHLEHHTLFIPFSAWVVPQSRTFSSRRPSRAWASSSANLQVINVFMELKGFILKCKSILQDLTRLLLP